MKGSDGNIIEAHYEASTATKRPDAIQRRSSHTAISGGHRGPGIQISPHPPSRVWQDDSDTHKAMRNWPLSPSDHEIQGCMISGISRQPISALIAALNLSVHILFTQDTYVYAHYRTALQILQAAHIADNVV